MIQLALALEDVDSDIARIREDRPIVAQTGVTPPRRKPLPDHLPREDVLLDIDDRVCACCGGALHPIGESISEMLDWVPAQLRVVRIARPKYACRACNRIVQAAAPERSVAGGLATPALLAQVLVSKYCDHTPLYRPIANLCPPRRRSRPFDFGRLGWRRVLVARGVARAIVQGCVCF